MNTYYLFCLRQKRDEEVVCYGELGCFRDEGPFNYLDMLPSPPEEVGTQFLLYTRKVNAFARQFGAQLRLNLAGLFDCL